MTEALSGDTTKKIWTSWELKAWQDEANRFSAVLSLIGNDLCNDQRPEAAALLEFLEHRKREALAALARNEEE